ncbi:MAG: component of SufBCD complex [Rhodobacter sp.]|nr:component of SufBCD complex [Paracoccaceae bacterium]MCB1411393.1 component of SufBCD complex [Paracoccaceae bacterium]MCC0078614.1 component of SufBCD complex [Rhodobacter sp.]
MINQGESQNARLIVTDSLFSTIDLRSFSNVWFWLVLAVAWSNASHFLLGVPFDLVQTARRKGGEAMADFETLARIQSRRRMQIMERAGVWLVAFWMAVLSALAVLGFRYGLEFAQALVLLLGPLTLAAWLTLRLAARIDRGLYPEGDAMARAFGRQRILVQAIGLFTILVTTMWGMWQNLTLRALG